MRQRQDEAYVLGTMPLGDADLVVTLLAEHSGRVRGVARSARRSRVRFGGSLAPMSRVFAIWTERPEGELHRIESVELHRSFASMQSEPLVQAACALFAEMGMAAVREDQEEQETFRLYGAVLEAMEGGLSAWCAVRYFEFWLLRLHGVFADLGSCAACGGALAAAGGCAAIPGEGLACRGCAASRPEAVRLPGRERTALLRIASEPPSRIADLAGICGPGGALAKLLRASAELFLEKRLKAYRHLEAMA